MQFYSKYVLGSLSLFFLIISPISFNFRVFDKREKKMPRLKTRPVVIDIKQPHKTNKK